MCEKLKAVCETFAAAMAAVAMGRKEFVVEGNGRWRRPKHTNVARVVQGKWGGGSV